MRKLSEILRRENLDAAYDAVREARIGTREVTSRDLNIIRFYQIRTQTRGLLNAPLWLLSSYGPNCSELETLATELIEKYKAMPEEKVVEFALPQALTFLLRKTPPTIQRKILEQILETSSLRLRFSAAENLLEKNKIEQGLREIINLVPILDYDHAIADAIPMYFTEYCTPELKIKFLEESNQAFLRGEEVAAADIRWAVSYANHRT